MLRLMCLLLLNVNFRLKVSKVIIMKLIGMARKIKPEGNNPRIVYLQASIPQHQHVHSSYCFL